MIICSIPYVLREYKFKQQWDTITNLLGWPKSETLAIDAGENMDQKELSFIVSENAKWYSHCGIWFDSFLEN